MANLMRNNLLIEGKNVKKVLDFIGFNSRIQPANTVILIDFERIVPRPQERPDEGWEKWISENWGTMPYDGYLEGDIFEVTNEKAFFKFYTKSTSAFPVIDQLARQFLEFTFHLSNWELTNHWWGEAEWEKGERRLYVPLFARKSKCDADVPACDPVSDEMRATAAQLVGAAMAAHNGCSTPQRETAESIVAKVIAMSGQSVNLEFEPNADGSCCLCVYVEPLE